MALTPATGVRDASERRPAWLRHPEDALRAQDVQPAIGPEESPGWDRRLRDEVAEGRLA